MLKVENLCKTFPSFRLKNVSFEIPEGAIVGFVGQNGAGKTTTLKCIMRSILPDEGTVVVCGKDMEVYESECKQLISFSSGTFEYYRNKKLAQIVSVFKTFFDEWSQSDFDAYAQKFNLNINKRVKELSAGMKVKFTIALALSHNAKLFIFDEPTSGLDPLARDELLDIFRDLVLDGDKSILFSTHITDDLDKCADYVLFIKDGEIILNEAKDALLDRHCLIKGGGQLDDLHKQYAVSVKENSFGYSALIERKYLEQFADSMHEKPNLDDIMVYYAKRTAQKGENDD